MVGNFAEALGTREKVIVAIRLGFIITPLS